VPSRNALVTGGGRGIGENIARALAADGWSVTVTGRTREQVEAVAGDIGGRALDGDVSSAGDVARWAGDWVRSTCSSATPASAGRTIHWRIRTSGGARSR